MKLYKEFIKALFNKFIKREKNGEIIKNFCKNMGIAYIKLAQILSTQNIGKLFTEEDRIILSELCDDCEKVSYSYIETILNKEYDRNINEIFLSIDPNPIGSASISQVHKAILKNGDIVAIKIKRKDITDNIDNDIKQIKKLALKYGKYIGLKNKIASKKVLDLYLNWIYEETDFINEKENIIKYTEFAKSVNNKVENTKLIKVPKVYEKLCTENIIVMEYIEDKTINHLSLDECNKKRIAEGLNSYIKSSFYALLNQKTVIFHGDPHNGNIYLDKDGNIGFLDMGNTFELSKKDAKLCLECFLAGYTNDYNYLFNFLKESAIFKKGEEEKFKQEVMKYCQHIHQKPLTNMFADLMFVCLDYNICPPDFLFGMAKVFTCLNGLNGLSLNKVNIKELLSDQITEYFIRKNLENCKGLVVDSLNLAPKILKSTKKYGLVKGISKESNDIIDFFNKFRNTILELEDTFVLANKENDIYTRKYQK